MTAADKKRFSPAADKTYNRSTGMLVCLGVCLTAHPKMHYFIVPCFYDSKMFRFWLCVWAFQSKTAGENSLMLWKWTHRKSSYMHATASLSIKQPIGADIWNIGIWVCLSCTLHNAVPQLGRLLQQPYIASIWVTPQTSWVWLDWTILQIIGSPLMQLHFYFSILSAQSAKHTLQGHQHRLWLYTGSQ